MSARDELFFSPKNAYEIMSEAEVAECFAYAEGYKKYLSAAKTERLAVKEAVKLAEARGFKPFEYGKTYAPGDKVYDVNRGKALTLAVIGKQPMSAGVNIAGAHVDAPRVDLKQMPLYEDSQMAFFKTHYYGGIRKYQWVTIPLELHGTVAKRDGSVIDISIGAEPGEPQFIISDLLPHLAGDQGKKPLNEAFSGEGLNILIGSIPDKEEGADRVKLAIMKILNEKYGIIEEDFLSAEIEAVPAYPARDIGLDRSLIGGYGHDDRVCAYAELAAIMDTENPEKTAVCLLVDKEEVGSQGVSGMMSTHFDRFMEALCKAEGTSVYDCYANSVCLSADVCNAYDPNFPEVSEKRNNCQLNYGIGIIKFTGSRGKSGSNDASAEMVGRVRKLMNDNNVVWQMGELGKVDQGGGGTIAYLMGNRDIDTIDAGVPVLNMHAPMEVISKADAYMTYRGFKAMYNSCI
ncbi:MAG: aminopeptidase [Clostridiales bacterium]|nr:aminopeptidase [Clostridiales bacterium]